MREVLMNQGKVALVDDCDYDEISKHNWTYNPHGGGYASRTDRSVKPQRTVLMHRQLLKAETGQQVDHINRNRLDNRRENLRICSPGENARNATKRTDGLTSKYKGVFFNKENEKFAASIQFERKRIHVGYYDNEEDAAFYYNQRAISLHGDFAVLNELPADFLPSVNYAPENARGNYSKYRGVTYDKREKKFVAQIQYDRGKRKRIGAFMTQEIAAEMYNVFAVELHGENAKLNVITY